MGDISENFNRSEFACKCGCGMDTVDVELITILEKIREFFGKPIMINSGNRCLSYNKKIGGAKNSQHMLSRAADIVVQGVSAATVYDYIDSWHSGGLGKYAGFTHVDSRIYRVRW